MKENLHDQEFQSKRALWPFIKQIFGYSFKYKMVRAAEARLLLLSQLQTPFFH